MRWPFRQTIGGTPKATRDIRRQQVILWAYTAAIAAAEGLIAFVSPLGGVIGHALLLPLLLTHSVLGRTCGIRKSLPALALIPLLRILSMITAAPHVPALYWYATAGLLLLFAVALTARLLGFTWAGLGLQIAAWPPQLLISLSSIPLSWVAYRLNGAILPYPNNGPAATFAATFLLLICSGMLEELLFRGLVLQATRTVFGPWAIVYSSVLYAVAHIGWQSAEFAVFAAIAGLFWGWCAMRTGSIWGVMFAHGILNAYTLMWPLLVR